MLKKLTQTLTFARQLQENTDDLRVAVVTGIDDLEKAKQLHAKVFHDRGYVKKTDLTEDGLYIGEKEDPYQNHAQYFIVERINLPQPKIVAAARLILVNKGENHHSFQTYRHQAIYPKYRQQIESLDPATCAEVSGLVKERGESTLSVLLLYKAMWQYSLINGHQTWIISCDAQLYRRLKALFGGALIKIGDTKHFKGHEVVPTMLEIGDSLTMLLTISRLNPLKRPLQRLLAQFFLRGLPVKLLSPRHHEMIKKAKINTGILVNK